MFVVRTLKPLKKWVILIALQSRYTFYRPQTKRLRARKIGLQYKILRASVALRATCVAPARKWLAIIDFQSRSEFLNLVIVDVEKLKRNENLM